MKIKLTKTHKIIIMILIMLFFFIVGLWLIVVFSKPKKIPIKPISYNNNQNYDQKLESWKKQCDFKPGIKYQGMTIMHQLGKGNKKIYFLDDNNIISGISDNNSQSTIMKRSIQATKDNNGYYSLDYNHIPCYFFDEWRFVNNNIVKNNTKNLVDEMRFYPEVMKEHYEFNTYVDTTPPPNPPQTN